MEQPSLKALIVDDEQPARNIIIHYLSSFSGIQVAGECSNGFEAIKLIRELKPDILFLDVQMPKITGLELLDVIDDTPAVIFTTAYDQYALKAFDLNAVDYLLKPFSQERFALAVNKVIDRIKAGQPTRKVTSEIANADLLEQLSRIVVKNGTSMTVIPVSEILFVEAREDYVMIYSEKGRFMKPQTMNFLEQHLPDSLFIRIHRSYIVNIEKIQRLEPYDKDTFTAIIPPSHKLRISRTGYKKLKDTLRF